jgi:hypothetical protein
VEHSRHLLLRVRSAFCLLAQEATADHQVCKTALMAVKAVLNTSTRPKPLPHPHKPSLLDQVMEPTLALVH